MPLTAMVISLESIARPKCTFTIQLMGVTNNCCFGHPWVMILERMNIKVEH